MLKATNIRMDYLKHPMGVADVPQIGWILESDRRNVVQQAYQLQIADEDTFEHMQYDSGWVDSDQSVQIKPEGVTLHSCRAYYVRVRVRDKEEESKYSESASFVTGILHGNEWQAGFISAETEPDKDISKSTYLRKKIAVKGEIAGAYVCTTALGLYHFYINGQKAGEDELAPGWTSYRKHLCYQTYDVTKLLKQGDNTLGAMLGAGWYKGKMGFLHLRNNYGGQTAFLMQMVIRYRDGRAEQIVTDDSWQGEDGPVTFSEIYDGEQYDAGQEIPYWNENEAEHIEALGTNSDRREGHWRQTAYVDFPMEALTAQAGGKVAVMDRISVQKVLVTPEGHTVLDFGQNLTGWIQFRVKGRRGALAILKCFETLDAKGNVYTANLRTAKQEICYICKDEHPAEYHPYFTFQGFRYAQVLAWPGEVRAEDFTACVLHSQMEETGTFSCSHPLVNQLQHNILWGLKGNFVDIPTDCPQRDERMGWTGDAQIFCRTACYLMNTDVFFRKWMTDVAADQTPEGGVPHVVPDIISGKEESDWLLSQGTHSAAAWADVAVINPWTLYLIYRDKTVLARQYESMKSWISFMQSHAQDNIWNYRLQFGDWVALDAEEGSYFGATPNDLTCTAYYAYSTGLFVKAARVLGQEEDAKTYQVLYEQIVDKFQRTFFKEDGSLTAMTQTAHIVALYFGLTPKQHKAQTARKLTELLKKENGHLVTGFVGTPYFCHALSQNGYAEEAYQLLLKEDFPSWLYQIKMGATTVWEHWDGQKPDGSMWSPDMNSFNHYAYGAVGDWLYRVVLGIEADEEDPGYHHAIISPQTGDALAYAQGTFDSMYGQIAVRWEKSGEQGERRLSVTIPHNTTASLRLEAGAAVTEGGGLSFAEKDGIWEAQCGSGTWNISYQKSMRTEGSQR